MKWMTPIVAAVCSSGEPWVLPFMWVSFRPYQNMASEKVKPTKLTALSTATHLFQTTMKAKTTSVYIVPNWLTHLIRLLPSKVCFTSLSLPVSLWHRLTSFPVNHCQLLTLQTPLIYIFFVVIQLVCFDSPYWVRLTLIFGFSLSYNVQGRGLFLVQWKVWLRAKET